MLLEQENKQTNQGIVRFLFTVVSLLPVPLVKQVTGPRVTTVNMIRTLNIQQASWYFSTRELIGCED